MSYKITNFALKIISGTQWYKSISNIFILWLSVVKILTVDHHIVRIIDI